MNNQIHNNELIKLNIIYLVKVKIIFNFFFKIQLLDFEKI